jgi:hypothetical protein
VDEERLLAVFRALRDHGVEYAVVGAVALGLHGLARATADLDLFVRPDAGNVERLKAALRDVHGDPAIEEISAAELVGDYPAVRYVPPDGFSYDVLTRLGEAFGWSDLETETKTFGDVPVRVVTPHFLWRMKKHTVRWTDAYDAQALAERFGFKED